MKTKKEIFSFIKKYFSATIGVVMSALAVSLFYNPNKIVSGGLSGLSTVLYHAFDIPLGVTFVVINAILLVLALIFLEWKFVLGTAYCATLLSTLVEVFSFLPPATNDVFLATIFGSILFGFGIGLTLINGACSGGTDILSRLLQKVFPHIKIGTALLLVDLSIVLISLITFKQIDLALFGIIALYFSSTSINILIKNLNVSKLAFIITSKGVEVCKLLTSTSPRGVTIIEATGGFTMDEKKVLMCALKEKELPEFQKKVLSIDPTAFIIFSESQQIVGNGFYVYR